MHKNLIYNIKKYKNQQTINLYLINNNTIVRLIK